MLNYSDVRTAGARGRRFASLRSAVVDEDWASASQLAIENARLRSVTCRPSSPFHETLDDRTWPPLDLRLRRKQALARYLRRTGPSRRSGTFARVEKLAHSPPYASSVASCPHEAVKAPRKRPASTTFSDGSPFDRDPLPLLWPARPSMVRTGRRYSPLGTSAPAHTPLPPRQARR